MAAPSEAYPTDPLPSLRELVSHRPDAIYLDVRDLSRVLGCSEEEAEVARRWLVEDSLEVLG